MPPMKWYICLILFSCTASKNVLVLNNIQHIEIKGSEVVELGALPIKVELEKLVYDYDREWLKVKGTVFDLKTLEKVGRIYCIKKNQSLRDTLFTSGKDAHRFHVDTPFGHQDTLIIGAFSYNPRYYTLR